MRRNVSKYYVVIATGAIFVSLYFLVTNRYETGNRWAGLQPYTLPADFSMNSTCSLRATLRGPGQGVVSFSYYGDVHNNRSYFKGIETNARLVRELYPGWTMRVYHNITDTLDLAVLHAVQRRYADVLDTCFAGQIPGYGNVTGAFAMTWRFLALSDPLVDVVLSRDLDSFVSEREVAAVSEWLQSNLSLHIMRDHPVGHDWFILGGMWGARVANDRRLWREKTEEMMKKATRRVSAKKLYGFDQRLILKVIWPLVYRPDFTMQHDSYFCDKATFHKNAGVTRPFPTRRNVTAEYNFVGSRRYLDAAPLRDQCPLNCRRDPSWMYC